MHKLVKSETAMQKQGAEGDTVGNALVENMLLQAQDMLVQRNKDGRGENAAMELGRTSPIFLSHLVGAMTV